jgi:hypothetical protein
VTVAAQISRGGDTDDAGADDGDFFHARPRMECRYFNVSGASPEFLSAIRRQHNRRRAIDQRSMVMT